MMKYRRYRRRPQLLVWTFVGLLILMAMTFGDSGASVLFNPAAFLWLDDGLWQVLLAGFTLMLLAVWMMVAFSVMALVVVLCGGAAMAMLLSGFSLLWPLLLLMLAAWGIGKTLQADNQR
ncbi:hypothetical protein [Shewanella sp. YIC-542]|uniref:hypothetical protein n=1 Tax=Shewanella mytili TaxID=3377111 RepID=UPI00398E563F